MREDSTCSLVHGVGQPHTLALAHPVHIPRPDLRLLHRFGGVCLAGKWHRAGLRIIVHGQGADPDSPTPSLSCSSLPLPHHMGRLCPHTFDKIKKSPPSHDVVMLTEGVYACKEQNLCHVSLLTRDPARALTVSRVAVAPEQPDPRGRLPVCVSF